MTCRRSFEVDLAAFVCDARGPEWAAFRDHYPLCPDCSLEVRTWTELELALQGGVPPATAHPTPGDLLHACEDSPGLEPAYRRIVEDHLRICRPCADEIAALRGFDFEASGCVPAAPLAAVGAVVAVVAADEPAVQPFANGLTSLDAGEAAPEPPAARAAVEVGAELDGAAPAVDDTVADAAAGVAAPEEATAAEEGVEAEPAPRYPPASAELPATLVRARAPGLGTRLGRLLLHPAFGAFAIAAVLAPILAPMLLRGRLPEFPFGRAAPIEIYREVRVSSGVAAATRPAPAAVPGRASEGAQTVANETMACVAVATVGDPMGPAEPAAAAPPDVPPAAGGAGGPAPRPVTRLDGAEPAVVAASEAADDLLLEVPVPPTVPDDAVVQVTIRGEGEREIVERLPLSAARAVTVRVAASWLVPGAYRVELGIVKRGPAPVRVADYALTVR